MIGNPGHCAGARCCRHPIISPVVVGAIVSPVIADSLVAATRSTLSRSRFLILLQILPTPPTPPRPRGPSGHPAPAGVRHITTAAPCRMFYVISAMCDAPSLEFYLAPWRATSLAARTPFVGRLEPLRLAYLRPRPTLHSGARGARPRIEYRAFGVFSPRPSPRLPDALPISSGSRERAPSAPGLITEFRGSGARNTNTTQ